MKINSSKPEQLSGEMRKIAIILPRFNDELGTKLLNSTIKQLQKHGVASEDIGIFRCPGAMELPYTALKITQKNEFDVIIALGIIIQGATPHFDLVCRESHAGLMKVSLDQNTPIIFGIITAHNLEQVVERIEETQMNKGADFADAALEMAQ